MLDNIRSEIWLKLWGNLTFNPISSLAHATLVDICQYPPSRELAANMMREAQDVAGKLGIEFRVTLEKRIAGAEKVGKHKTSMLQDIEAGRAPEIDALVGSVVELGRLTQTPTPHIDTVYALVKLLARDHGRAKGPAAHASGRLSRACRERTRMRSREYFRLQPLSSRGSMNPGRRRLSSHRSSPCAPSVQTLETGSDFRKLDHSQEAFHPLRKTIRL